MYFLILSDPVIIIPDKIPPKNAVNGDKMGSNGTTSHM